MGVAYHRIVQLDVAWIGGSALTTTSIDVPKNRAIDDGIPVTYVPARNTIFLAHALAWAEVLDATEIFAGMNAIDYSGYPDCRPSSSQRSRRWRASELVPESKARRSDPHSTHYDDEERHHSRGSPPGRRLQPEP